MHSGDITVLVLPFINGIFAFGTVLIACEIGQRMNEAFDKINFTIDQFNWYSFPIGMQQMLPIIIAVAQQPITLECFGSIKCTREVFKKVGILNNQISGKLAFA